MRIILTSISIIYRTCVANNYYMYNTHESNNYNIHDLYKYCNTHNTVTTTTTTTTSTTNNNNYYYNHNNNNNRDPLEPQGRFVDPLPLLDLAAGRVL